MNGEAYYQVQTDYFAGPLDLLLHLIKKKKMDILDIRISDITSDYLLYLQRKECLQPARESEFLATAATLIYIKARSLLPRIEEEGEVSAETQLVQALIAYEKIQKIAAMLRELEQSEARQWRRPEHQEIFADKEYVFSEVSAFQLAELFYAVIRKKDREDFLSVSSKKHSIEEKWQEILNLISAENGLDFSAYIWRLDSLEEVLFSFFTLLEMIKRRALLATQNDLFGPIVLWLLPQDCRVQ